MRIWTAIYTGENVNSAKQNQKRRTQRLRTLAEKHQVAATSPKQLFLN